MVTTCACGCGVNVRLGGDYRRDCRLRELAAGRSCPRNVRSAAQKSCKHIYIYIYIYILYIYIYSEVKIAFIIAQKEIM